MPFASALPLLLLATAAAADWRAVGRADGGAALELTFAVRQQRLAELERELLAVSDPDSPRYGAHLTQGEVDALVAPAADDVRAVTGWLAAAGADPADVRRTAHGDFVVLKTTAAAAEALLGGRYYEHRDAASGAAALRMDAEPALPAAVAAALDFVAPTTQPLPRRAPPRRGDRQPDGFTNTPASLRKLYGVDVEASAPGNRQAVTAFLEQHRTAVDLQDFFSLFYSPGVGRKIARTVGDGAGEKHVGGQVEAELDTQYVMAMGGNVPTEFWSFTGRVPGEPENEPFLKFLVTLANTTDADVPLVISTSYGEDESSTSPAYAARCNAEFQKAGARGITLLFSSGDSGVAGVNGTLMNSSNCGTDCSAGADCFVPQWPAASPWVVSVGGTKNLPGRPEGAWGGSSGGFSTRWARPAWQEAAVSAYVQRSGLPDPSRWRNKGRAFPDVAAQSVNFMVILDLVPYPVSGTSCASPTFAGVVSLLNDLRLQAGAAPLGFLSPLLYSRLAAALTDVVKGSNPGCGTDGFPAAPGWDPVTGLGTPNYPKMAALLKGLPAGRRRA